MICRPFNLSKHSSFYQTKTRDREVLLSWEQLTTAGEVCSHDWQQLTQLRLVLFAFASFGGYWELRELKNKFLLMSSAKLQSDFQKYIIV